MYLQQIPHLELWSLTKKSLKRGWAQAKMIIRIWEHPSQATIPLLPGAFVWCILISCPLGDNSTPTTPHRLFWDGSPLPPPSLTILPDHTGKVDLNWVRCRLAIKLRLSNERSYGQRTGTSSSSSVVIGCLSATPPHAHIDEYVPAPPRVTPPPIYIYRFLTISRDNLKSFSIDDGVDGFLFFFFCGEVWGWIWGSKINNSEKRDTRTDTPIPRESNRPQGFQIWRRWKLC